MKTNLFGLFQEEIAEHIREHKLEKYRAKQIAEWMYRHHASSFSEMTTLSKKMQAVLEEHFVIERVTCVRQKVSADNKTIKFLFSFADGETAETVLMRQPYGNSVCLSTQVGCAMGCLFCASTLAGLKRNLT
ncbi:MAG: 23S rRNA (adenine(2503)-C(2))-methyltransferase RlmN, partial [Selenomonadales bacterium]|nr:23S rRNA (adenine(2503)-C(2))-methyltransferase RlmN [Selenomonadales bacterium]